MRADPNVLRGRRFAILKIGLRGPAAGPAEWTRPFSTGDKGMPDWMFYAFGLITPLLLGGGLAFTLWQFRRASVRKSASRQD